MESKANKMIMAVLQGEDYPDVIKILNDNGYYVTVLNSSGGFLKKRSATIMLGVEEEKLQHALDLLKTHACSHMENTFQTTESGVVVPIQMQMGGLVYFVMNIEDSGKC